MVTLIVGCAGGIVLALVLAWFKGRREDRSWARKESARRLYELGREVGE